MGFTPELGGWAVPSARRQPVGALPPLRSARLLDQVHERLRGLHYSRRTEESYVYWILAFIRFHGLRHPSTLAEPEVEAFLTHLAAERGLAVAMHRQTLSALLLLYGKVLQINQPALDDGHRPPGASATLASGAVGGRGNGSARPLSGRASLVGAVALQGWGAYPAWTWCFTSRRLARRRLMIQRVALQ